MAEERGPIRAPEFPTSVVWLQGGPLKMANLKGRPVLIDFWDYTCINCIRAFPYLKEWHRRYSPLGLTIVGVHAPEFSFAGDSGNVRRAVEERGVEYPVVLDNEFDIWKAYTNRYWPARYLVDAEGYLRYFHFGEGGYGETEQAIHILLRQAFPQVVLPDLMEPLRDTDRPGAVCYRVTPEVYLGYERGRLGNPAVEPDRPFTYRDPGKHLEGFAYLEGHWLLAGDHLARPVGAQGESRLTLRYLAKEVNLVAHPPLAGGGGRLELRQDAAPLPAEDAGEDVRQEAGRAVVSVDIPRMYRLVNNRDIDAHELVVTTASEGLTLFAFTFVSCVIGEE